MADEPSEWRSWSTCPPIRAMQEETSPGHCVLCDAPLRQTSQREKYICHREACQAAYNAEYKLWQRREQAARTGKTQRGTPLKKRGQGVRTDLLKRKNEEQTGKKEMSHGEANSREAL